MTTVAPRRRKAILDPAAAAARSNVLFGDASSEYSLFPPGRVSGAQLKAAIPGMLARTLSVVPHVNAQRSTVRVTFVGTDAFCKTDCAWDRNKLIVRVLINLPAIGNSEQITRGQANSWTAYALHELAHAIFTPHGNWMHGMTRFALECGTSQGVAHKWINSYEDVIIERLMISLQYARGFAPLVKGLVGRHLDDMVASPDAAMTLHALSRGDPRGFPLAVAYCHRKYGLPRAALIIDTMAPRLRVVFDAVGDQFDALQPRTSEDTISAEFDKLVQIAITSYLAIKDTLQIDEPPVEPPVGPEPHPGPQDDDDDGEPQDGEPADGDGPQGEPQDGDDEDDGQTDGPGGYPGAPEDGDDDGEEGSQTGQDGPQGDDQGADGSTPADDGDDAQDAQGEPQDAQGEPQDGDGDGSDRSTHGDVDAPVEPQPPSMPGEDDYLDADVQPFDDRDELSEEAKASEIEQMVGDPVRTAYAADGSAPAEARVEAEQLARKSSRLLNELRRVLTRTDVESCESGKTAGRLRIAALPRATISDTVFERRDRLDGTDSAVCILLDGSQSMSDYERMENAKRAVLLIGRLLTQCPGVRYEIAEFHGGQDRVGANTSYAHQLQEYGQLQTTAKYTVIKSYSDPIARMYERLPTISAMGNTPDLEALVIGVRRLRQQQAGRRIVIMVTDGTGDRPDQFKAYVEQLHREGVTTIGICIGYRGSEAFDYMVKVEDVSELSGAAMSALLRAVTVKVGGGDAY